MKITKLRLAVVAIVAALCLAVAGVAFGATTKASIKATRTNPTHAKVTITVKPTKCGALQKVLLKRTGWAKAKTVKLSASGKFSKVYAVPKKTVTFTVVYKARRVGHHPSFTTCSKASDKDKD
jgi:hypothetical protein